MTPTAEDLARLEKQVAMLLRALARVKAERDELARQLAETEQQLACVGDTLPPDEMVES